MNATHPAGAPKARVTQGDIARVAGVHHTTVSLVLRNGPGIPEATRQRIRSIAGKMGYFQDPMLRALVEYRHRHRPHRQERIMAYLTNWGTPWGCREALGQEAYHAGAQRRAEQLGFHLVDFCLDEPGTSPGRLGRRLADQQITCVLLAAHRPTGEDPRGLDWSQFSAVAIGRLPAQPALHRVGVDPAGTMRLALRQVRSAGYERVGLVVPAGWDDLAGQAWSTAFLAEQNGLAAGLQVPILPHDGGSEAPASDGPGGRSPDRSALAAWYDRHRPEAVLAFSPDIAAQLGDLGLSIPDDVGFVDLFLTGHDRAWAGVRQHCERVGEIAAETAVGLMRQNIRGTPAVRTTTSVDGAWVDGATLRAPRPPPARLAPEEETPAEPALTVLA